MNSNSVESVIDIVRGYLSDGKAQGVVVYYSWYNGSNIVNNIKYRE